MIFPAWADADGGWSEGPGYWTYYIANALYFAVPLRRFLAIDVLKKPFFQNTGDFRLFTNPANADISPFGDEEHKGATGQAGDVMHILGMEVGNPNYLWYAEQKRGAQRQSLALGLLNPPNDPRPPANIGEYRYFKGAGLVSLHTQLARPEKDIHFLFHSNPRGSISHAHPDQNAFTVTAGGRSLFIASGYYPGYGSPHHKDWQWSSRSSNTITYDGGRGQKARGEDSHGSIVESVFRDSFSYVVGDATPAYNGDLTEFTRHVLDLKDGIYIVHDIVRTEVKRHIEWNLHSKNAFVVDAGSSTILARNKEAIADLKLVSSDELDFIQSDQFSVPSVATDENQWHLVASTRNRQNRVTFTSVLRVAAPGESLPAVTSTITNSGLSTVISITGRTEATIRFDDNSNVRGRDAGSVVEIAVRSSNGSDFYSKGN